jgi:TonB family protein
MIGCASAAVVLLTKTGGDMRMWSLRAWTFISVMAALTPSEAAGQQPTRGTVVDLSYPAEALAARVTGTVVVRVTTDASSRVVEAEALSGPLILRQAAVANVGQWTLWTGLRAPAPRTDFIAYHFEIDQGRCNDDSRSVFRVSHGNLAVITACSGADRKAVVPPPDDAPVVSYGATPRYPEIARRARVEGAVILDLSVDATGQVTDVRILRGIPLLNDVAVDHAKTWRVQTTSALRKIFVYEFILDVSVCAPVEHSAFRRVTVDHLRLVACSPTVEANVTDVPLNNGTGIRR